MVRNEMKIFYEIFIEANNEWHLSTCSRYVSKNSAKRMPRADYHIVGNMNAARSVGRQKNYIRQSMKVDSQL